MGVKSEIAQELLKRLDSGALDMSQAARLRRAAEQGFDVEVFHGSKGDIGDEILDRYSRRGSLGTFYATTDKNVASNYGASGYFDAGHEESDAFGGAVYPMLARSSQFLDLDTIDAKDVIDKIGVNDVLSAIRRNDDGFYDEMVRKAEDNYNIDIDDYALTQEGLDDLTEYIENYSGEGIYEGVALSGTSSGSFIAANEFADDILKSYGKQGFKYKDMEAGGLTFVASEGNGLLRSINAAFDPEKISSTNLLASHPYATGLSGLAGISALSGGDVGGIEARSLRYPEVTQPILNAIESAGDVELPIVGRPLQGLAEWARGVGYKSSSKDKLKRAATGALDLI